MLTKRDKVKDPWTTAKIKYRLTERQIEMAKKLGMNPKKFGKLTPNKHDLRILKACLHGVKK